ncbi:unnamed protein product [Blepharisma stoltei]|uniref:Uncharacterized protein n=1 Tax=Blepharisma stoltei TaxID=1481888 RepID=A0AAU9J6X8_9CILI|nr:unnamed protein product [Blepharisma stoltei]
MVHTCQKVFDSLSLISIFGSNHFTAKILFFKHQEINTILSTKYAMTSFCENLMLIFKKFFKLIIKINYIKLYWTSLKRGIFFYYNLNISLNSEGSSLRCTRYEVH